MELGIGNVHPGCPNAGNPFHECTARCFERITFSDVPKKEKKLFGFGKKTPVKNTPPSSPARVMAGNRSPLPSYYAKKKFESDDSPSYSSSEDNVARNFFKHTPPRGRQSQAKNVSAENDSLPMSPSLAVYTERDQITSRFDRRRVEPQSHLSTDAEMSPRTPTTRPMTPKHQLRMPTTPEYRPSTPETRPRTPETRSRTPERHYRSPEHHSRSRTPEARPRTPDHQHNTLEARPRTPETRPRTAEYRVRSPEHRARSPGHRSRTPEPQARYLEPRARTPEPRARTPEPGSRIPRSQPTSRDVGGHQSTYLSAGQRSPQTYNSAGNKADSVYTEDDEESILLYPELLLSPQERPASRPITPERSGYETPTKQEEFEQLAESESSDDNFSFVDDREDRSVFLHPEIVSSSDAQPKSGSSTPVHHKLRTSSGQQEDNLKHNEPPELPDESQSFTLSEIARMRGLKHYETQSVISESYVSVGNYKVRASVSATLQHILDKHGDVASDSKLQSLSTRSYYLETLATMVLELQSTPLRELKETRVAEMLTMVKDIESVKIRAGWFRSLLEEILEAAKHFDSHEATVVEKEVCGRDLLLAKQEMEVRLKELAKKEKETKECRERVTETGGRLGALEMKRLRLDKSLAFLSSKVDKFQGKCVLEDIL